MCSGVQLDWEGKSFLFNGCFNIISLLWLFNFFTFGTCFLVRIQHFIQRHTLNTLDIELWLHCTLTLNSLYCARSTLFGWMTTDRAQAPARLNSLSRRLHITGQQRLASGSNKFSWTELNNERWRLKDRTRRKRQNCSLQQVRCYWGATWSRWQQRLICFASISFSASGVLLSRTSISTPQWRTDRHCA